MTPEQKKNVENWIAALESGEYPKGKNWLNSGGNFCCLGVLCELQNVPKKKAAVECGNLTSETVAYVFSDNDTYIYASTVSKDFFEEKTGLAWHLIGELADKNDRTETFKEVIEIIKGAVA